MIPINTAVRNRHFAYDGRAALGESRHFENERGVIFFNDLCRPLTQATLNLFRRADCVCSIVAWRHGFRIFHERAGVQPSGTHAVYIAHIRQLIQTLSLPSYIVTSKRDAMLMAPDLIRPITLFDEPAMLAEWQPLGPAGIDRAEDLPALLATRYRAVLDFSCGYGSIVRPFRYFIGSDIDTKCLNYIEREIMQ